VGCQADTPTALGQGGHEQLSHAVFLLPVSGSAGQADPALLSMGDDVHADAANVATRDFVHETNLPLTTDISKPN
jgi:hypothetical protein